jgi:DNA-binding response OmpR family regulator
MGPLGSTVSEARGRPEVVSAQSLQSAREMLGSRAFAVMVLDPGLPDGSGLELLDELPQLATTVPGPASLQGDAAETRHTLLPVSSAINSPP